MPRQLELFPHSHPRPESAASETPATASEAPPRVLSPGASARPPAERSLTPRGAIESLTTRLERALGETLASVVTTNNRSRIVSARRGSAGLEIRIHRVFHQADAVTLSAVADVLLADRGSRRRRQALEVVRDHFERHRPKERPKLTRLKHRGAHYDLSELRDRVNRRYFDDGIDVHITWGRAPRVRGRRARFSLRLGSYDEQRNLVRIHPCLDRPDVPAFVVESVVYHEMLHAAVPPERRGGRRRVHGPEFQRRERLFEHFEAANRWLEAHLEELAKSRGARPRA